MAGQGAPSFGGYLRAPRQVGPREAAVQQGNRCANEVFLDPTLLFKQHLLKYINLLELFYLGGHSLLGWPLEAGGGAQGRELPPKGAA